MNGLCVNPRLSGGLACSAGPWSPAGGPGPWRNTCALRAISRAAPARVLLAASHSPCIQDSAAQGRVRDTSAPAVAPAKKRRSKNAAAWRRKKEPPPLLCASGRPVTQKNNSQLSGCDLNILCQDPGSIPAPHTTFRKSSKK